MFSSILVATLVTVAAARSVYPHPAQRGSSLSYREEANLPNSFKWASSGPLIYPRDDERKILSIKDPSIVLINGTYHVFASTGKSEGYNLVYLSFTDFAKANDSTFHYLDQSAIGEGYRAAPEVFYFEPHGLWYLVYQDGNAAYSTNKNIDDPKGWTAPKHFYKDTPKIIKDNLEGGYWVDMWVICDTENCHLFSSDDNGRLYRSQTSIKDFPNGMSDPVIALKDDKYALFEASNVYNIGDGTYLLVVEAIGSDGYRYFRSWTSNSIAGPWNQLAATEDNPFARYNNVAFKGTPWTTSISHGELVRTQTDQTLSVRLCEMTYLYQGMDPEKSSDDYNSLPWRLAILTQLDSKC